MSNSVVRKLTLRLLALGSAYERLGFLPFRTMLGASACDVNCRVTVLTVHMFIRFRGHASVSTSLSMASRRVLHACSMTGGTPHLPALRRRRLIGDPSATLASCTSRASRPHSGWTHERRQSAYSRMLEPFLLT